VLLFNRKNNAIIKVCFPGIRWCLSSEKLYKCRRKAIPSVKVSADSIKWLKDGTGVILKSQRRSPAPGIRLQKNEREILNDDHCFESGSQLAGDIHSKSLRKFAFWIDLNGSKSETDRSNPNPMTFWIRLTVTSGRPSRSSISWNIRGKIE
jgi:hypothetical protein